MPKLGETVIYVTSKNQEIPAIVLTTPESFVEGSSLEPLAEGELNIMTLRLTGLSPRTNVPSLELATKRAEEDPENTETEFVRYWKPLA